MVDTKMKAWSCPSCGTHVEPPFAVCYNCGTHSTGEPDPTFEREVDAAVEAELRGAEAAQTQVATRRRQWQFTLRGLLLFVFVLCGLLAIFVHISPIFWFVVLCIVVANVLGVVVAWIVTNVFGIPNDGSNPFDGE